MFAASNSFDHSLFRQLIAMKLSDTDTVDSVKIKDRAKDRQQL